MSIENRPNLNAVGLLIDILAAIDKRKRGEAGKTKPGQLINLVGTKATEFVEEINSILNDNFKEENKNE
jgi:hypothetical protein